MRTDIRYVNSKGISMEFGGDDTSLHYFENELRDWEWEYTSASSSSRITSFSRRSKKPKKIKFHVGIAAATEEEGLIKRNELITLGEADIVSKTPGKLYIGDWYINCYIIAGEPTNYWLSDRFAEFKLTLLAEDPSWIRETIHYFNHEIQTNPGGSKKDFPKEFPFDLGQGKPSKIFTNDALGSVGWLWRVYGPATNPYMRINNNLHQVNTQIPKGAYMEVNSAAKTIVLIGADGKRENLYAARARGTSTSDSYIFKAIDSGDVSVLWDNTFDFDLTIFESCSTPPYEKERKRVLKAVPAPKEEVTHND